MFIVIANAIGRSGGSRTDGLTPSNTIAPVISGTASVGSVLTSTTGTWTGTLPITYTYQWLRNGDNIIGATSSTYTSVLADSSANISCRVTATNSVGSANATSNALAMNNYTPSNTVAPVVSGTNTIGSILTTTNGTWLNSPSFTYQWLRNGSNIGGATSSTYTLVTADTSNEVSCRVTATNSVGSANATSNSLTIYEAEYKSVLDYATTNSYTLPSTAQRLKQNTLLSSLKTAGVWNKLDTFANFATDGSSNFALIDWKRVSLLTAVNSPTFTTNEGFTGNGTSSYIDTNFNPVTQGVNYTQNNASRYLFMFLASGTGSLDGRSVASINNMSRTSSSNQRINQSTTPLVGGSFDFTATKGMKSIHRTNSTNVELFNATTQGSRTATSATMTSSNQFILRSGSAYGAHKISMYANGSSLVSENTSFVNAFDTYLNSL